MPDPPPRDRSPSAFTLGEGDLSLATDLYQLTMAAAYAGLDPMPVGTFELFVRHLPPTRNFLVFAGLEQALAALVALRFDGEQIDYLRGLPPFRRVPAAFFERLAAFRFDGEVWAMPEGSVFFAAEPVLRVTAPLWEAQLVETLLLSIVNFQTAIASKAARIRLAAGGDAALAEFGSRRAHGPQAAAWAARAAWLGGFDSTSNVLAGQRMGIPVVGTMAHSFVMAFADEEAAFRRYLEVFPEHATLLVDTYDTLDGVRHALALGVPFAGVRLDSGDLGRLAVETRRLLDAAGRREARIFASGDMDETKIAALRAARAPIDAFGVGTQLSTSADAPYLGGIYKLVEVEERGRAVPKFKASPGKSTYPGKKQVARDVAGGRMRGDRVLSLDAAARLPEETLLLRPVMRQGRVVGDVSLAAARERCRAELGRLPEALRGLAAADPYPVVVDPSLEALLEEERGRLLSP
jgi:nicotinate phosphoribosyltransferase